MPTKRINEAEKDKKASKPLMEKRRRARINQSLAEIKALILRPTPDTKGGRRSAKLEKADILELTVRHLHKIHKDESPPFREGYAVCLKEVDSFFVNQSSREMRLQRRLKEHLLQRLQDHSRMETSTPPVVSTTTPSDEFSTDDDGQTTHSASVSSTGDSNEDSSTQENTSSNASLQELHLYSKITTDIAQLATSSEHSSRQLRHTDSLRSATSSEHIRSRQLRHTDLPRSANSLEHIRSRQLRRTDSPRSALSETSFQWTENSIRNCSRGRTISKMNLTRNNEDRDCLNLKQEKYIDGQSGSLSSEEHTVVPQTYSNSSWESRFNYNGDEGFSSESYSSSSSFSPSHIERSPYQLSNSSPSQIGNGVYQLTNSSYRCSSSSISSNEFSHPTQQSHYDDLCYPSKRSSSSANRSNRHKLQLREDTACDNFQNRVPSVGQRGMVHHQNVMSYHSISPDHEREGWSPSTEVWRPW